MKRPPIRPRANKNKAKTVNGINTKLAHLMALFNPIHTKCLLHVNGATGADDTVFYRACPTPASSLGNIRAEGAPFLNWVERVLGPVSGPPVTHSSMTSSGPTVLSTSVLRPPKLVSLTAMTPFNSILSYQPPLPHLPLEVKFKTPRTKPSISPHRPVSPSRKRQFHSFNGCLRSNQPTKSHQDDQATYHPDTLLFPKCHHLSFLR